MATRIVTASAPATVNAFSYVAKRTEYKGKQTLVLDIENSKYPTSGLSAGSRKFSFFFKNDVEGDNLAVEVAKFCIEQGTITMQDIRETAIALATYLEENEQIPE